MGQLSKSSGSWVIKAVRYKKYLTRLPYLIHAMLHSLSVKSISVPPQQRTGRLGEVVGAPAVLIRTVYVQPLSRNVKTS